NFNQFTQSNADFLIKSQNVSEFGIGFQKSKYSKFTIDQGGQFSFLFVKSKYKNQLLCKNYKLSRDDDWDDETKAFVKDNILKFIIYLFTAFEIFLEFSLSNCIYIILKYISKFIFIVINKIKSFRLFRSFFKSNSLHAW